jgi:hypothetical protein
MRQGTLLTALLVGTIAVAPAASASPPVPSLTAVVAQYKGPERRSRERRKATPKKSGVSGAFDRARERRQKERRKGDHPKPEPMKPTSSKSDYRPKAPAPKR